MPRIKHKNSRSSLTAPASISPKKQSGPSDPSNQELCEKLRAYLAENHLSWTQLSRQLGVTQNTLTNWNKGGRISERNKRSILALVANPIPPPVVMNYKPGSEDPISSAMRKVWAELSEHDRALVYMLALECRDGVNGNFQHRIYVPTIQTTEPKIAEPKAPYRKNKRTDSNNPQ